MFTDGGSILLDNQLEDYFDRGVDQIIFADSTVWTRATLRIACLDQLSTDGNDTITGFDASDLIRGKPGSDSLNGKAGKDTLNGGNGNDFLTGGDGDDQLFGDEGDNNLSGGTGSDSFDGGVGNDTADFSYSTAVWVLDLTAGTATSGTTENLVSVENLTGGSAGDILVGNSESNILQGGTGNDTLTGGEGNDIFKFHAKPASNNQDLIKDFKVGSLENDMIYLGRSSGFTTFSSADANKALAEAAFVSGTAATAARAQVIYNQATGQLLYDADGTGTGSAIVFANLDAASKPALTNANFFIC